MRGTFEQFERSEQAGVAVKRAVGFAPQFPFVAEVTLRTDKGFVTAREGSHMEQGAVMRAKRAAQARVPFAGMRRAVGFAPETVLIEDTKLARAA